VPTRSIVRSGYLSGSVPLRFSRRGPQTSIGVYVTLVRACWSGAERAIYSGAMFGEAESDEGVKHTAVKRKAHPHDQQVFISA